MKTKEVYEKNKQRKYCPIVELKQENIGVESNPIKIIKKHFYKFLIGALLIILILLLTFHKEILSFGVSVGIFAFLVLSSILINSYTLKCKKDTLYMTLNFQKFELPYSRIANIYLSRDFNTVNFIPKFNYSIVVRYVDNLNLIKELSFSTLFLKPEDIEKFLENFEIDEEESEQCIKYEKYKMAKKILKVAAFVLFVVVIGVLVFLATKK